MRQMKLRTVLRSLATALILTPVLAHAQSGASNPSPTDRSATGAPSGSQSTTSQPSQGSGTTSQPSQGSGTTSPSAPSGSTSQTGASGSQQSGGSGQSAARQSIDPAEVQRVFGSDATLIDLQSLGTEQIRSVQQALQDRGHYQGTIDGVYGPQTRAGLKAMLQQQYSLNQRLINQGQLTGPIASSIGLQSSDRATVGGIDSSAGQQTPGMSQTQPSRQDGSAPAAEKKSGSPPAGATGSSPNTGSSSGSGRSSTGSSSSSGKTGTSGSGSGASSGTGAPHH